MGKKVKIINSEVKIASFESEAHGWWRHATNEITNVGVKCQQLHKFTVLIHGHVFFSRLNSYLGRHIRSLDQASRRH